MRYVTLNSDNLLGKSKEVKGLSNKIKGIVLLN